MSIFRITIAILIIYPLHVLLPSYVQDLVIFFNPIYSIFLFVVFLRILFKKREFVLLVPILCSLVLLNSSSIRPFVRSNLSTAPITKFKVATFNANNFMLFDQPDKLIDWVKKSDAGIICFQEYRNQVVENLNNDRVFSDEGYIYQELLEIDSVYYVNYGLKVFSKYPLRLLDEKKLEKKEMTSNGFQIIEIDVNSKKLIFSNCHLNCYKLTEEVSFLSLFSALKVFMSENVIKNNQCDDLLESINRYRDSPAFLVGDFNSFNYSYVSRKIRTNGFYDSFREAGKGPGETLNHKLVMPLRIDYQYHNKYVDCKECYLDTTLTFSDHKPLICEYEF